jgi:ferrous iron transport protein B
MEDQLHVALVGNPNAGKSSLFNALTGMRQRVGNYPGVTVDRKSGYFTLNNGRKVKVTDLPGAYSLFPKSEDEQVTTQVLRDPQHPDAPDLVLLVADATNLRRSLLLATQVADLGLPMVLVINMIDLLQPDGGSVDCEALSKLLGVPVVTVSALQATGLSQLKQQLQAPVAPAEKPFFHLPASLDAQLTPYLGEAGEPRYQAWLRFLQADASPDKASAWIANELAVRYDRIQVILDQTIKAPPTRAERRTSRLDRILLHPVAGYLIFVGLLFLVFQAIFAWAEWPMNLIEWAFAMSGEWIKAMLPAHFLTDLLVDGIWAGLGGIVVFVPQIALLFFFISLLEDSGYMSRVVFLMDRIVRPFGFSGKSVIPLIGGMACAVPSIMMARTIPNKVERLITIMVTPLMSCSARIPVYVLLIGLFVPDEQVLGIFNLKGVVMAGLYFLGFFMALAVALVIKVISRYRSNGIFVTELPLYRIPRWKNTAVTMFFKSRTFVVEAGKVILVLSIVLWLLKSYGPPGDFAAIEARFTPELEAAAGDSALTAELTTRLGSEKLRASYAGMLGRGIEPVIRPLGFDWKIGIALISSFAAREVFVGTMATLYSASEDESGDYQNLRTRMAAERDPETGKPVYTAAVAMALLIFYAFAMQCMSTVAVVQRETKSWRLAGIMVLYMTGLAYLAALLTYQIFA